MKKLLLTLALAVTASAMAQTPVTLLAAGQTYSQNNPTANPGFRIFMSANDTDSTGAVAFESVDLAGPAGLALGTTANGFSYANPDYSTTPPGISYMVLDEYATRAEVPNGRYTAEFTGGYLDGEKAVYHLNEAFIPNKPPLLNAPTLHRLQFARSTRAIKLRFPAQRTHANAVSAALGVSILHQSNADGNWYPVFYAGALPLDTNSVIVPANTLGEGSYTLTLYYSIVGPPSNDDLSTLYYLTGFYTFDRVAALATEIPNDD